MGPSLKFLPCTVHVADSFSVVWKWIAFLAIRPACAIPFKCKKIDRQWAVTFPSNLLRFILACSYFSQVPNRHYCFANCFSFGLRALAASRSWSQSPFFYTPDHNGHNNDIGKCIHPSIEQNQPTGIFIVFAHAEYISPYPAAGHCQLGLIGKAALLDWWENLCETRKICILSAGVVRMLIKITDTWIMRKF